MKDPSEIYLRDMSFPACFTSFRKEVVKMIDVKKPEQSISKLLKILQQQQHPSSLLKHWSMGQNLIEKSYDFKIIWLHRNFASAVYSHHKWDTGLKKHSIMVAAYHLYIASGLYIIEKLILTCAELSILPDCMKEKEKKNANGS
eukprot:UN12842